MLENTALMNIAKVERDTGISKDTLRIWERRYPFPRPQRNSQGERLYSQHDVDKLFLIKKLIDSGQRPAKLCVLTLEALSDLAQNVTTVETRTPPVNRQRITDYLLLIKQHQIDGLRQQLAQEFSKNGLVATIKHVIAPMTYEIGEYWRRGELAIFEEHLFSETIQSLLRTAMNQMPRSSTMPKILLTTFPQEPHGLGLLMAESVYASEGCPTLSLGTQTPIWDIVQASTWHHINVVALSFSSAMNRQLVLKGLRELRQQLPARIEIWVGGSNAALGVRMPDGIISTLNLDDISTELQRWLKLHSPAVDTTLNRTTEF